MTTYVWTSLGGPDIASVESVRVLYLTEREKQSGESDCSSALGCRARGGRDATDNAIGSEPGVRDDGGRDAPGSVRGGVRSRPRMWGVRAVWLVRGGTGVALHALF